MNNIIKRISIKKGVKNSVHMEPVSSFIKFLKENGMKKDLIRELLLFHYADGTINGTGKIRLSTKEYKTAHQKEIDKINEFFNTDVFIKKAVNRFVLQGNNSNYCIDAIIYGVVDDFIWITKDEIVNILLKHKNISKESLVIGGLFYQPWDRCLNNSIKYNSRRHYIQIKWYHLSDDIIETMVFYIKR